MKDRFSANADAYRYFRPSYPDELYDFIFSQVTAFDQAWDCGTGNGQVAVPLAAKFKFVWASDISEAQLNNATKLLNINYSQQAAEHTNFPNASVDLVTIAQAIHWFDFEAFYKEVRRVLKPGAKIVVMGYGLMQCEENLQGIILHFYKNILGSYWDAERKYIDEHYCTIPFPFNEIQVPAFSMNYTWTLAQLLGYLSTWSACKLYKEKNKVDALSIILPDLERIVGQQQISISFPILLRIGTV